MIRKIINKFIVWYILKHNNAVLNVDQYVVRVFSQQFYNYVVITALDAAITPHHGFPGRR